jgi:hypothetical protein
VVVVDPEFAHEEEGSAEEVLALCRANVHYLSVSCSLLHVVGTGVASWMPGCTDFRP